MKQMEDEANKRIKQYRDYASQLKARYLVYEEEAGAHYERITEDMRLKVKNQLAAQ